jgi:asparagine synthase (glutamine-hydrolysing)
LSIVGIADGQQPMYNETRSVVVVFNGELFDHAQVRGQLIDRGHRFASRCDTEVLVHLWEEYGEQMFDHLQGQFAFALYDTKQRTLILARDRIGICPLHWARTGERLYFGSEVKALLASGEIEARADLRGIDHVFSMFAMPGGEHRLRVSGRCCPGRTCASGSGRIRKRPDRRAALLGSGLSGSGRRERCAVAEYGGGVW